MKRHLVLVLVLAACRPATPIVDAQLGASRSSSLTNASADTAEREFERSLELDYRRPMSAVPRADQVPHYVELFVAKCIAGDRAACLRATMRTIDPGNLLPQIKANCRAGHQLSCRSVAGYENGIRQNYPFVLSVAEQRIGCAAGLWVECDLLFESESPLEVRYSAEISCLYARRDCSVAGKSYRDVEPRNLDRVRYLLELGCQSADLGSCLDLAYAYVEGDLQEPVPGRGRELIRYVCARAPTNGCEPGNVPWNPPTTD